MDVNRSLFDAVREGRLEDAKKLINSYGLSYSPAWSKGYVLLCEALKNRKAAVAKLLLTHTCKVNSKTSCVNPTDTPLHFAVPVGDIEIVKMILDKGANINAKNSGGKTPLHDAIEYNKIKIVEILLNHGANVNDTDNEGPLNNAIEYNKIKIVELLLKHGANVNAKNNGGETPLYNALRYNEGKTPLYKALKYNNIEIVELLLKHGANVNDTDNKGGSPLHVAVGRGHEEMVTLLLSRGAHVDFKGEDGITCLHVAAKKGYVKIAKDLLNHGACIHSLTLKEEYTPLHFASEQGNREAVELLLDKGADLNATTKGNVTPLHLATKMGHGIILWLLLHHGAKVDNQDKDDKTILPVAVENGCLEIVEVVLKYRPDINNQSNKSCLKIAVLGYRESYKKIVETLLEYGLKVSPEDADDPELLHTAVEKGYLKIVGDLLKYGANVNTKNNGGETPLYNALRYNNIEIVELLLKHGANVNDTDNKGGSPLHVAVGRGHEEMVTLLLSRGAHVDFKGEDGITCLHVAAKKGYVKIAKDLLNHGACIHSLTLKEEYTPLHFASEQGNREAVEVAELLISYKADTNAFDKNGKTPIFYAIKNANLKITKLLLSSGADIKYSPVLLNMAVKKEQIDIVEALLQLGADVNACDIFGRTALHVAAESERKLGRAFQNYREPEINIKGKIATLLLSKGANVNAKQKDGMTALHIAIRMDHKDVIKKLLECGAKVENCMLHLAAKRGCCEIIEAIMKLGGDINSKNIYGRTALHIASQKGHTKVVVTLLNYGADINITCNNNHTPLDYTKMGSFYMHMRNDSLFDYPSHDIWSYTKTSDVLEFYMVKMRTANLYVEGFSQILSNSCKWRPIEDDCKKEIEIMKSEKINNANVSFYDILAKGINSTAMYLRNENILLALKSGDYKTKFPFYASMLTSNFNMGLKRKELLEQGNKVSHLIFNHFPALPQDCTERIFSYLNDKELRILIKACYPI